VPDFLQKSLNGVPCSKISVSLLSRQLQIIRGPSGQNPKDYHQLTFQITNKKLFLHPVKEKLEKQTFKSKNVET
jgi:hypothetical protein